MKFGIISSLTIAVAWGALAIAQLWFHPLSAETFIKISITAAILVAAILLVTFAVREYLSNKRLEKDGFIDG